MKRFVIFIGTIAALLLILLVGAWFRYQSLDWDAGQHQHPDERFLTMVASSISMPSSWADYFQERKSSANPYNRGYDSYAYGTAPLFLTRILAEYAGYTDYQRIYTVGRAVSAALDVLTILMVFLIGRLWLPRGFSLLAAGLYAVTVFSIQQAHFFTVDSAGSLMMTICLYGCIRMIRGGWLLHTVWVGAALGLGMACRINLLVFAVPVLGFWSLCWRREGEHPGRGGARACTGMVLTVLSALLAFRCAQPYAFDEWWRLSGRWLEDVGRVIQISRGAVDVPYTRQWVGRTPWLFPWVNMVRWGTGWALGLCGWIGALAALGTGAFVFHRKLAWTSVNRIVLFCSLWMLWPFFWHGHEYLMTMRYFLPMYPALVLLAAWMLMTMREWMQKTVPLPFRWTANTPWFCVLLLTVLWALAFSSVYRKPHTRITASQWMFSALPSGSVVAAEHWDDELPLSCRSSNEPKPFIRVTSLPLYDADTPEKLDHLLNILDGADFIVLASNRLCDSIPRLPGRYPATLRYYEALFNGTLGFEPVAEFVSYPSLGGFVFDDSSAEEAFSVYDHPRVRIYSKTTQWNPARARRQLSEGVAWDQVDNRPAFQINQSAKPNVLTDSARAVVRAGGTWSRRLDSITGLFDRFSFSNRHPVTAWLIMVELLTWMAFPVAFRLFPFMPDKGWLAAKIIGPVLMTYVVWLLARCGVLSATPGIVRGVFAAGLLMVLIAFAASKSLRGAIRTGWRLILTEEFLYWGVFAVFLLLRCSNPDLWHPYFGGEKPMDFAYLNAAVKSTAYPPYNPWCAGETINYYYMGFVMSSIWIKLTGIIPAVAYNLILPTVAANTALLAFCGGGLLLNVYISAGNRMMDEHPRKQPWSEYGISRSVYFAAGFIALFLTVFSGNLYEWVLLFQKQVLDWDWFWAASRAIQTPKGEVPPITEFPFFTFLYGDLHAHMLDMPLFLLNALFCMALVRNKNRSLVTCAAALNAGLIHTVNAWDYPAALLLLGWAYFVAIKDVWPRRVLYAGLLVLAVGAAGYVLFLPFHLDVQSAYGSFRCWNGPRTGMMDIMVIYGIFIIPLSLIAIRWLAHRALPEKARRPMILLWFGFLLLAAGMVAGVEYLVLDGDIGRMNTVFKFYLQAWMLLALVTGAGAGLLWNGMLRRERSAGILLVMCGLVWLASLLYPFKAVPARARCRFNGNQPLTLNGAAFMNQAVYQRDGRTYALCDDLKAIEWIQENVFGTPVLVEAQLPEYTWGGRYSIYTGLPTPLGWSWHQRQQHAGQPDGIIAARARDVAEIYNTLSLRRAWDLMQKYHAEYLVVGPAERSFYDPAGLEKFRRTNEFWNVTYTNAGVTLYRLNSHGDQRP